MVEQAVSEDPVPGHSVETMIRGALTEPRPVAGPAGVLPSAAVKLVGLVTFLTVHWPLYTCGVTPVTVTLSPGENPWALLVVKVAVVPLALAPASATTVGR